MDGLYRGLIDARMSASDKDLPVNPQPGHSESLRLDCKICHMPCQEPKTFPCLPFRTCSCIPKRNLESFYRKFHVSVCVLSSIYACTIIY